MQSIFLPLSLYRVLVMFFVFAIAGTNAGAAPKTNAQPAAAINQFSIEPLNQFAPGTELTFTVEGTPRGRASVRINGVNRTVALQEVNPGIYEGSYTITTRDKLTAAQTAQATLRVRNQSANSTQRLGSASQPASTSPVTATATAPAGSTSLSVAGLSLTPLPRIEPGAEIKLALSGTSGAKASFTIDGIARDVPMQEIKPGQYEGSYTIRRSDQFPANPAITASLEANGTVVRSRLTQALVSDNRPPVIRSLSPKEGETVAAGMVVIAAAFDDEGGTGMDAAGIHVLVGGNDVTRSATVSPQQLTYRAPLQPGRYPVEITARDRAGNTARYGWTFTVAAPAGAQSSGSGLAASATGAPSSLPVQITSHANNARLPSGPTQIRGLTAPDATVNVRVQSTTSLAGSLGITQQVLTQTFRADASGNFSFTFQPALGVPTGRYEVIVSVSKGNLNNETRLTLLQQ